MNPGTVFVDPLMACVPSRNWRYSQACHLFVACDTPVDVLHEFAEGIGLKRCWFQRSNSGLPHYDLTASRRIAAVRAGAVELDRRQAVGHIRAWRTHLNS